MSKKIIPAVFLQKKMNSLIGAAKRPTHLDHFERALAARTGGRLGRSELGTETLAFVAGRWVSNDHGGN